VFLYGVVLGAGLIVLAVMRDDTGSSVSNKAVLGTGFFIIALVVFGGVLPLGPLGL
jgi:hypothetical protein